MTQNCDEPRPGELGAVAARLAASLMLFAAALFGVIAIAISQLQTRGSGDDLQYVLPWAGERGLASPILLVMIGCAVASGLAGLGALAVAPAFSRVRLTGAKGRRRPFFVLLIGLLVLAAALAMRHAGWR